MSCSLSPSLVRHTDGNAVRRFFGHIEKCSSQLLRVLDMRTMKSGEEGGSGGLNLRLEGAQRRAETVTETGPGFSSSPPHCFPAARHPRRYCSPCPSPLISTPWKSDPHIQDAVGMAFPIKSLPLISPEVNDIFPK